MKKTIYLTLFIILIINSIGFCQDGKKGAGQTPKPQSTGSMIGPQPFQPTPQAQTKPALQQEPLPQTQEAKNLESVDYHTEGTGSYTVKRRISNVSKGYRIQIYSGPERAKAKATKIDFMKRFPSVRSYITYAAPYYRIRIGDFKTRQEANDFYRYLGKSYTVMIVPSLINNRIPPRPAGMPANRNEPSNNTDSDTTK
ncbi:hypothetical protein DBR32_08325 [Taibaiella sp. KBW10]|uniref:SPOR domain-containing protein n=1 Tax=Taibaiella sp. KBW10 TaxID=2153357 RepID=UPI000F5A1A57|nr:SPOR domain-containing protein [Taibaiella sp. KBW10]RQO30726.1 hypothetical protein DBR32_08325 [Taibaiella sp. KBW10]